MKARVPKSWEGLPKAQKEVIADYMKEVLLKREEEDARLILDRYIKMACIVLHDAFGFGEKRLNMFLGNHKRMFHRQHKMVKNGTQEEYLDRRMAEIFRKNGFPKSFFDNIIGEVIVVEEGEDNENNR